VLAVVGLQLGRHAFQLPAEEHIQEEGFEDIVAVVAQGDLVAAQFIGRSKARIACAPSFTDCCVTDANASVINAFIPRPGSSPLVCLRIPALTLSRHGFMPTWQACVEVGAFSL
jgi:hypothetical protein